MTLHEYVGAVARHWVVILVAALVGGLGAFLYARTLTPQYRASASVIAIPETGATASDLVQGSVYVQNLVQSYAVLASSPFVLDKVAATMGLAPGDPLPGHVTVDTPLNTVVIEVSITDSTPQRARDFANGVVAQLATSVEQLSPQGSQKTAAVRLTTISPASLPVAPFSPNTRLNTALGVLAGLALGVAYALARRLRGRRLVDADTLLDDLGAPVIGEIFQAAHGVGVSTTLALMPTSPVSESFRVLAANLGLVHVDGPLKVLLVTSGRAGEGKSSVTLGLAMTLAESEERVLVVDADLRRPSMAEMTQLEGAVGVTTVLRGGISLADAVQPWGPPGLDILASGVLPPKPTHLLASARFRGLLAEARERYDLILIDTPPVLNLSDSLWLAPLVDGTVVIARAGRTRSKDLGATLTALENTHTPVLGVVANGLEDGERNDYYSYSKPVHASDRGSVIGGLGHRVRAAIGA
ncbi:MAG: polysaccharide biosynthesis tyrosine autokinase [Lapillicoccus sp.]